MKKYICCLLAGLLIVQLASCAIHRKFPFICFRKECVLSQLGYYSAQESFRRAKINAKVRKHKREVKKNVKLSRKGKLPPYDIAKEKKQADSLTYTGGFSGICKEVKIIFSSNTYDTVVAHYSFDQKDLSENDKRLITELIKRKSAEAFNQIIIINCHKRSVLSEYEAVWMDQRVKKIEKFLKPLGILRNKVTVDE